MRPTLVSSKAGRRVDGREVPGLPPKRSGCVAVAFQDSNTHHQHLRLWRLDTKYTRSKWPYIQFVNWIPVDWFVLLESDLNLLCCIRIFVWMISVYNNCLWYLPTAITFFRELTSKSYCEAQCLASIFHSALTPCRPREIRRRIAFAGTSKHSKIFFYISWILQT